MPWGSQKYKRRRFLQPILGEDDCTVSVGARVSRSFDAPEQMVISSIQFSWGDDLKELLNINVGKEMDPIVFSVTIEKLSRRTHYGLV